MMNHENKFQVFSDLHKQDSCLSIQSIKKSNMNLNELASDVCLCQRLNQNCWTIQRYKLAIQFFKNEIEGLKKLLESSKMFLNLVIHDLRNPST